MIKAAIPDAEVTIRDLAGDGDHYAATVIVGNPSAANPASSSTRSFINRCRGQMGGVLHALALQTGSAGLTWSGTGRIGKPLDFGAGRHGVG